MTHSHSHSHFRCEVKTLSKSVGQSAAAACRYDTRANHRDKSDLAMTGLVNMPSWAHADPTVFWKAADEFERANGMVARRSILSFPNQLPESEYENYIREWLSRNVPNCPASWAIHNDPVADPQNPHCHILISERMSDGIVRPPELFFKRYNLKDPSEGGCKKADIGSSRKDWLLQARASWASILNKHLPLDQQVSHLSNDARGLLPPQPKFGAKVLGAEKKGIRTQLVSSVIEDSLTTNKIRCLSFVDQSGREVTYRSGIDRGDSIEITGKVSYSKVIDLVNECREKGWAEVELFGTDEFKRLAGVELTRACIKIKGEDDEQNSAINTKSDRRIGKGNSKGCRTERPQRSAQVGATTELDRRPDEGRECTQQQANCDDSRYFEPDDDKNGQDGTLDNLGNYRQSDVGDIASTYHPLQKLGSPGMSASARGDDMQKDLTAIAVQKHLSVMSDIPVFEIGILNQQTGKMMISKFDERQIVNQIARLKRENARGNNIYIRPDRHSIHPYILLDDLELAEVEELEYAGFDAALVIETSPINHQVLLKLPQSLDAAGRKQIELTLHKRFGSDIGCCDGQHFFRLGGFTNRKPKYEQNGRFPFVKILKSRTSPRLSPEALMWLDIAKSVADVPDDKPERVVRVVSVRAEWSGKEGDLVDVVAKAHQHLKIRYGSDYNPSIADFKIAQTMLKQGWGVASVREGLRAGSPDLQVRKVGHVDDYLNRTISNVTGRTVTSASSPELNYSSQFPQFPRS